jgi:methionine-S-sulfoxide reductase
VGYAGDSGKQHPTYHDLGRHAEAVQLDFDPTVISYRKLLDIFFREHNPFRSAWSPQYRAAVFVDDDEQERAVRAAMSVLEEAAGRPVVTEVMSAETFWLAEDYHQKYRLQRNRALVVEFALIYPDFGAFRDSTAVARVNGYLDGYGSAAQFERELPLLGLSEEGQRVLTKSTRFHLTADGIAVPLR